MEVNQKKKNKDMAGREAFEIKEETQKGRVLSWQASEWKGETGEKERISFLHWNSKGNPSEQTFM